MKTMSAFLNHLVLGICLLLCGGCASVPAIHEAAWAGDPDSVVGEAEKGEDINLNHHHNLRPDPDAGSGFIAI